ncbi:hypothetical protein pb186bvf_020617 [Paramecium bursaria]
MGKKTLEKNKEQSGESNVKGVSKLIKKVTEQKTKEQVLQSRVERVQRIKSKLPKLMNLDVKQIKKCTEAVLKLHETDILDIGDDFIYLEIVLSKVPLQYSIRPIGIEIPNPLYSQQMNSKFCIISNNPQRTLKDKIQDIEIPLIQKVIDFKRLTRNYKNYTNRRKLFYEYDLFFCDQRIYSSLAKATGKVFYKGKKIPIPIQCENFDNYEQYLIQLANKTYFVQGPGPVYTLKVGRVAQNSEQITQNIISSVYDVIGWVLREKGMNLASLRSLSLKTKKSLSLPFFIRVSEREKEAWKQNQN